MTVGTPPFRLPDGGDGLFPSRRAPDLANAAAPEREVAHLTQLSKRTLLHGSER